MTVRLKQIDKTFSSGLRAVKDFNLTVEPGEFITFLGPSGCGKTTTLRCIAGLESPDTGLIQLDKEVVFNTLDGRKVNIPPEKRHLSMVFQQYALWPHLTVFDNVAFPLRSQKFPKREIAPKVERALRSVRLWDLRDRQISQLSGGQQQRIALARAIAPDPKVVLFDEPLSNLDVKLRDGMRLEILELQKRMDLTAIYVTHDQDEAFSLSSRIVVMNEGAIEQIGTPTEVWRFPSTPFVASFVGTATRVDGTLRGSTGLSAGEDGVLISQSGMEVAFTAAEQIPSGGQASTFLRSGDLNLSDAEPLHSANAWKGTLELQSFHGDYTLAFVRVNELRIVVRLRNPWPTTSTDVYLHTNKEDVLGFADK